MWQAYSKKSVCKSKKQTLSKTLPKKHTVDDKGGAECCLPYHKWL